MAEPTVVISTGPSVPPSAAPSAAATEAKISPREDMKIQVMAAARARIVIQAEAELLFEQDVNAPNRNYEAIGEEALRRSMKPEEFKAYADKFEKMDEDGRLGEMQRLVQQGIRIREKESAGEIVAAYQAQLLAAKKDPSKTPEEIQKGLDLEMSRWTAASTPGPLKRKEINAIKDAFHGVQKGGGVAEVIPPVIDPALDKPATDKSAGPDVQTNGAPRVETNGPKTVPAPLDMQHVETHSGPLATPKPAGKARATPVPGRR